MVSTYTHRSLTELIQIKNILLARAHADESVCAHLDAIQAVLDRRVVPLIRQERMEVDEEGCVVWSISYRCPACDGRCRPSNPYCPTCGQGTSKAAA